MCPIYLYVTKSEKTIFNIKDDYVILLLSLNTKYGWLGMKRLKKYFSQIKKKEFFHKSIIYRKNFLNIFSINIFNVFFDIPSYLEYVALFVFIHDTS
jgi:hypothetical protein